MKEVRRNEFLLCLRWFRDLYGYTSDTNILETYPQFLETKDKVIRMIRIMSSVKVNIEESLKAKIGP